MAPPLPDAQRRCPQRAFPARAYRLGTREPRPSIPTLDDRPAPGSEALLFGCDLLEGGFPWEAHEVWERAWQRARMEGAADSVKDLLQGLIQLAAARVLARDGRPTAALRVADRARARLARADREAQRFGFDPDRLERALTAALVPSEPIRLESAT